MRYTLTKLIQVYRSDRHSSFLQLKYNVRVRHERLLARLTREHGDVPLNKIRTRTLLTWYNGWLDGDKIAMAHALVSRLRVLFRFGATILEDQDCDRLLDLLRGMRFKKSPPRNHTMTIEQAKAFRAAAHLRGWDFLALAQSLQFELLLSQKDVIGEWVPVAEAGDSEIQFRGYKWLRGLRWSNIDRKLILRHTLGKQQRRIEVDLRTAPMVLEDLKTIKDFASPGAPLILNEINGFPYTSAEFRRKWRLVAKNAALPDHVRNSDSKPAGLIVGGPNRARISQAITPRMLNNRLRTLAE